VANGCTTKHNNMTVGADTTSTGHWREAFALAESLAGAPRDAQREAIAKIAQDNTLLAHRVALMLGGDTTNANVDAAVTKVLGSARVKGESPFKADDNIGAYTLMRPLGKGGMADVWLAQRTDGTLKRPVALKLPMALMPSPMLAERFARERDMLAQLDHPNIARIYDAGTTAAGQPFLALEFIDGEGLDHYCKEKRATINERVALVMQVAQAVHHAHSRLVLHRDLKPSNILVTREGIVKVLDFGIAKLLTEERTAEETQFTRMTGAALTPKYAAPEQLLSETVTTSTDVYAIAVLLYELLAGCVPFADQAKDLSARMATLNNPCRLLSENAISAPQVDALNASSERSVKRALAGDLTAILDKALRRAPNDRYPSALAFADDLQRYLTNRPVLARQGAFVYRAKKFVVRHKLPLAIATSGALASLALGVQAWQNQQRATESTARAASIDGLMQGLFVGMSPDTAPTRTFTAKELLDRAYAYVESSSQGTIDPSSVHRIGELYRDVGAFKEAERTLAQARDSAIARRDDARAARLQIDVADVLSKSYSLEKAEEAIKHAREMFTNNIGQDRVFELSARADNIEGQIAAFRSNFALAQDKYSQAEKKWRDIAPTNAEQLIWAVEGQASAARFLTQLKLARQKIEEVLRLDAQFNVRGEIDRLRSTANLGAVLAMDGRYAEAQAQLAPACEQFRARLGNTHSDTRVHCRSAAFSLTRTGEFDKASAVLKQATDSLSPSDKVEGIFLAQQHAYIAMYQGRPDEADAGMQAVVSYLTQQSNGKVNDSLLRAQRLVGELQLRQGKTEPALALLLDVEKAHRQLRGASHPDVAVVNVLIAIGEIRTGEIEKARVRLGSAVAALRSGRGDHHHFTIAAEAYEAIADQKPASEQLLANVKATLAWQTGTQELIAMLSTPPSARGALTRLVVVT
jgi:eukaryotic-like serine/threonine-protein kinase